MTALDTLKPAPHQIRRWVANVLFGYGDTVVGGIIYLLLTPLIIEHLGIEGYAVWIISHTITFYLHFLDIGLAGAHIRYHTRFSARNRPDELRKLTATIATGMIAAGAVGASLGMLIAFGPAQWWVEISSSLQDDFRLVMCMLAINLLVSFPGAMLDNVYTGAQRFDICNMRSAGLRVVSATGVVALLLQGHGIVALAALELFIGSLRVIVDILIIRRLLPDLLTVDVHFHKDMWKKIRRFATWSFVDDLLVEGMPQLDNLFVAVALPLVLLTPYSLCTSIAGALMMIAHPVMNTFFPMAVSIHAQNKQSDLRQLLISGSKLCLALTVPFAIFFGYFGEQILALWVPESSGQIPKLLLPIVVADVLASVFLATSGIILVAINGIRAVVMLTLLEVGLTLIMILLLAPSMGLLGIGLSCLTTNIGVGFFLQLPIVTRATGMPLYRMLTDSIGRVALASLPALALTRWLASKWSNQLGWIELATSGLLIGVTFLLGLLVFGTTRSERLSYLTLWRNWRHQSTPIGTDPSAADT
jgi:O-antigen/teichoic acid export membrane protein